jgi:hypothetical protein
MFEWAPTEEIREVQDGFTEFWVHLSPTRPHIGILQLIFNSMRVVIFSGDDQ